MKKVLVGMVALVSAVGGVAACGNAKTPVAKTSGVELRDVQQIADVKPADKGDLSVTGGGIEKTPRFTLVLGEGKGGFKFRSVTLSEDAKAKIDEMFTGDKFDMKDARFESEGYTDTLGSAELNHQVGLARAKAVKEYLGEYHEIPGDCIKVVSYGTWKSPSPTTRRLKAARRPPGRHQGGGLMKVAHINVKISKRRRQTGGLHILPRR
jgi:outer membrane protein OmpA-like peptidoglycan-associated protein